MTKHNLDNPTSTMCLEIVMYVLMISMSFFWALAMASIGTTGLCHGTGTGGNMALRICQEWWWDFLPLLINLIVLVALLLMLYRHPLTIIARFWVFLGYCLAAAFSPLILGLPFFYERLE